MTDDEYSDRRDEFKQEATEAYSRLGRQVVKDIKRLPTECRLSGDDSGLDSVWEEFKYQMQREHSVCFEVYEETIRALCEAALEDLPRHDKAMLWAWSDSYYRFFGDGLPADDELESDVADELYRRVCSIADEEELEFDPDEEGDDGCGDDGEDFDSDFDEEAEDWGDGGEDSASENAAIENDRLPRRHDSPVGGNDVDNLIRICTDAIRRNPKDAAPYSTRGSAYGHKGEFEKAIADCTSAIQLNPQDAEAFYNRARAFLGKGDMYMTIADCTRAIKLDPTDADKYLVRAIAYGMIGDLDAAITGCTEAIFHDSQFASAYNNRGLAYASKGDWEKAIADYSSAIEIDSQLAQAYFNRAVAFSNLGKFPNAQRDFVQAEKLGFSPDA